MEPVTKLFIIFVLLFQGITKDVLPLTTLEMEGSILAGLSNLFMEYIAILEKALTSEMKESRENGSTIILAESMPQQVSILANVSTLEQFFSTTVVTMFRRIYIISSELTEDPSVECQQHDIDDYVMVIQEAAAHLRAQFFRQFLYRVFSLEKSNLIPFVRVNSETGSSLIHDLMPSAVFQVLILMNYSDVSCIEFDIAFSYQKEEQRMKGSHQFTEQLILYYFV